MKLALIALCALLLAGCSSLDGFGDKPVTVDIPGVIYYEETTSGTRVVRLDPSLIKRQQLEK